MKELATEPFVSFTATEGTGFVNALQGACQAAGFMPKVVQEASQMQTILTLVAGGLGIALVPSSMRRLRMEDVCFLDIAEPKRSEEHTSELQSLMRISSAVFCLKTKKINK